MENDCGETSEPLLRYCALGKVSNVVAGACTYGFRISWDNLHGIDSYEIEATKSLDTNGDPDLNLFKI